MMKKLAALALAALLILSCSAALAESQPKVVGAWYLCYPSAPEGGQLGDALTIIILVYMPDGRVLYSMLSTIPDAPNVTLSDFGTWEPGDDFLSLWSTRNLDGQLFLTYIDDNDMLYAQIVSGLYMGFHRIQNIDFVTEMFPASDLRDRF